VAIKVRLSVISVFIVIALGILTAVFLNLRFQEGKTQIENLNTKKGELQKELKELEVYGEWTLHFWQIRESIDILSERKIPEEKRQELAEQIWMISRTYHFDPLLILAITAQESHGNPQAVGRYRSGAESGAYGLMQLKIETAKQVGKRFGLEIRTREDLMRPEVNIALGSAYLMRLIGRYGDLKHAIIAYNLGPGALDKQLKTSRTLPTRYYENVLAKYRNLIRELDFPVKS
jgi:hypothetical protein